MATSAAQRARSASSKFRVLRRCGCGVSGQGRRWWWLHLADGSSAGRTAPGKYEIQLIRSVGLELGDGCRAWLTGPMACSAMHPDRRTKTRNSVESALVRESIHAQVIDFAGFSPASNLPVAQLDRAPAF